MPRNENPVLFLFYIFRVKSCSIHGRTCSVVMEVTSLSRQEYTVSVGKIYLPTLHGKRKEVELFTLFLSLSKSGEDLCPTPKLEYQPLMDVHRHLYLVFPSVSPTINLLYISRFSYVHYMFLDLII